MVKTIQKCRICGNPHLEEITDFGEHWVQGFFNYPNKTKPPQRKITTKVVRCMPEKFENGCGLIQNLVSVDPRILYSNYGYSSSISMTMRAHLKYITDRVIEMRSDINSVLDIGGNTGELIRNHTGAMNKFVVDPSDIAKESLENDKDIILINDCYPTEKLKKQGLINSFDAIYSIACLYDIEDLHIFLKSVKQNLSRNGIYTFEVAYLPTVLKNCAYDGMVLEHISLFSFNVLDRVFKDNGLKIFRAEETETNGGSLLGFATHVECNDYNKYENDLNTLRLKEFELELDTSKPYKKFKEDIERHGKDLINILDKLKNNGEKIYIYGSSTKLNVILQAWNIGTNYIIAAAERDPRKIGGSLLNGIPIVSEETARKEASVFLVGPSHFFKEIVFREREIIKNGTSFLFPLPKIQIVDYELLKTLE